MMLTSRFKKQQGMTLIEVVVAIVLLGFAMVSFTTFLIPQVAHSADPHYQTRAVALGRSFMSQILSREFDEKSDRNGGSYRCGEPDTSKTPPTQTTCTASTSTSTSLGADGSETPSLFNDVDDYIGCWYDNSTQSKCTGSSPSYPLYKLFSNGNADQYKNFRVEVSVHYDTENTTTNGTGFSGIDAHSITPYKRIEIKIYAGKTDPVTFVAYKGNY